MVALDHRDRAAGPQHPPQRGEGLLRAGEVLEQEEHDDVVDGSGRHRRVVDVAGPHVDPVGETGRLDAHRQAGGLGELADRPSARHERNARTSHRERRKRPPMVDDTPIVNLRWTHATDERPPRRPHQRHHLGPLRRPRAAAGRRARRRAPRRGRRPPHRPLRRPGPALRGVVDRHRQAHGRHEAGRPEAVRAEGVRRDRPRGGLQPLHPARPQRRGEGPGGGPVGGERRDHPGAPRTRAAPRAGVARGPDHHGPRGGAGDDAPHAASAPCRRAPTRSGRSSRSTRRARRCWS